MATFRSRLLWLATARVVVVTLLLGSAILVQFAAPGALPVTPFFLLIALTYALTAGYGLLLSGPSSGRGSSTPSWPSTRCWSRRWSR